MAFFVAGNLVVRHIILLPQTPITCHIRNQATSSPCGSSISYCRVVQQIIHYIMYGSCSHSGVCGFRGTVFLEVFFKNRKSCRHQVRGNCWSWHDANCCRITDIVLPHLLLNAAHTLVQCVDALNLCLRWSCLTCANCTQGVLMGSSSCIWPLYCCHFCLVLYQRTIKEHTEQVIRNEPV